jgi:hypothetical protein
MRMSRQLQSVLRQIDDEVSRDLLSSDRTEHGDYLGIRSGQITFLPKGKEVDQPYASRNRVRTKAARAARKFCAQEHSDKAYEQFHLSLLTRAFSIRDLEVVRGETIKGVYTDLYDRRQQSKMLKSCMANLYDEDAYFLYTDYPQHVRMLVLWDHFKGKKVAIGRALIWKTNHGVYVDRIYGSEPAIVFMRNYVDNKGWMRYTNTVRQGMRKLHVETGIEFDAAQGHAWPYLDTMQILKHGDVYRVQGVVYLDA